MLQCLIELFNQNQGQCDNILLIFSIKIQVNVTLFNESF